MAAWIAFSTSAGLGGFTTKPSACSWLASTTLERSAWPDKKTKGRLETLAVWPQRSSFSRSMPFIGSICTSHSTMSTMRMSSSRIAVVPSAAWKI